MEKIKMTETFAMPCKCRTADNGVTIDILDSYGDLLIDGENTFEETDLSAVCVAINNHDRLVQERGELIERIQWLHQKLILEGRRYGASSSRMATQELINKIKGGE